MRASWHGGATADFSIPGGRIQRGRAFLALHGDAALQFSFLTPPQYLNLNTHADPIWTADIQKAVR